MELKLTKETLRFERLVNRGEEQVTIEGEATLPGSMRDAVTVLSVQAQAHIKDTQAGNGEAAVRGRVCFQVLYTQGDLTRIRALETTCEFTHTMPLAEVTPGMRLCAFASVQETQGNAVSGRMTLRALLSISATAFDAVEHELIARVEDAEETESGEAENLQVRMQTVQYALCRTLGEGKTLAREEFDLPAKLGVGDVLSASAIATAGELSGGSGRVGVSGMIEVRVLHRPRETGGALVTTVHELPYTMTLDAQLSGEVQPQAIAEVIDVMADSAEHEKGRTLRIEAEVRVTLRLCCEHEKELLEDLYSLRGDVLEPQIQMIDALASERMADVRESTRLQVTLPKDTPPIDSLLAAFAKPTLTALTPSGRRLNAEGIMQVTLIYLPVDSDIPYAVHTREPFAMTFPAEAGEHPSAQIHVIETMTGPTTSDRAELRCVLGLRIVEHGVCRIRGVTGVTKQPQPGREHGFVLVWPPEGESRWDTARRLRVAQSSLRSAGKNALLAFRR